MTNTTNIHIYIYIYIYTQLLEIGDLTNQKAAFLVSCSCLNDQAILLQYNTLKGVYQILSEGVV